MPKTEPSQTYNDILIVEKNEDGLFLKGLGPKNEDRNSDVETQVRSTMSRMDELLKNAGLERKDVVQAKVQIIGMNENFKAYNPIWKKWFEGLDEKYHPCRTTVARQKLDNGASIQMDVRIKKKENDNFTVRNSNKAPDPVGLYQHAIQMGNTLYISGIGPRQIGSKEIPGVNSGETKIPPSDYDVGPQLRSVFNNITYILEDAGFAWTDLTEGRFYLTNLEQDYETFKLIWNEYWEGAPAFEPEIMEVSALPTTINAEGDFMAIKKGPK